MTKKNKFYSGLQGPLKYVKFLHFNNDNPQFKNIYIRNYKNTSVMVYDGKKWQLKNIEYVHMICDNGIEFMEDQFEEMKDILPPKIINKMIRFQNHMNSKEANDLKNNMTNDIKLF